MCQNLIGRKGLAGICLCCCGSRKLGKLWKDLLDNRSVRLLALRTAQFILWWELGVWRSLRQMASMNYVVKAVVVLG